MWLEAFTELEEVNWRLQVVMARSKRRGSSGRLERMLRREQQEHLHAREEGGAPLQISSLRVPSNAPLSGLFSPGSMHFTLFTLSSHPAFLGAGWEWSVREDTPTRVGGDSG